MNEEGGQEMGRNGEREGAKGIGGVAIEREGER